MSNPDPDSGDELVRLTDCADSTDAELLRGLLESEGIFVNLSGVHHRALMTTLGSHIRVDLWVRRADLARAQELLERRERGELGLEAPEAGLVEVPEPEALESAPPSSEEELERAHRRRRRRRKLAAWVLLAGPLLIYALVFLYLFVRQSLRLDWVAVKTPQFQVRFPGRPYHTESEGKLSDGSPLHLDRYEAAQVRSACGYLVLFETPGIADATAARQYLDSRARGYASQLRADPSAVRELEAQGFPAREVSGVGQQGARPMEARARWVVAPSGIAHLYVVCPAGEFRAGDAKAFIDSFKLAGAP